MTSKFFTLILLFAINVIIPLIYLLVCVALYFDINFSVKLLILYLIFGAVTYSFMAFLSSICIGLFQEFMETEESSEEENRYILGKPVFWFRILFPVIRYNIFYLSLELYQISSKTEKGFLLSSPKMTNGVDSRIILEKGQFLFLDKKNKFLFIR